MLIKTWKLIICTYSVNGGKMALIYENHESNNSNQLTNSCLLILAGVTAYISNNIKSINDIYNIIVNNASISSSHSLFFIYT